MVASSTLIGTIVMPASQSVAWYMILKKPNIYLSVLFVSSFYCLWALYNRYHAGLTQELGQYSMGILAQASYCQSRMGSLVGTSLVLANFALPAYWILIEWSARTVAKTVKDDETAIVWAYVFKLFFVSNLLLWGVAFNMFYQASSQPHKRI